MAIAWTSHGMRDGPFVVILAMPRCMACPALRLGRYSSWHSRVLPRGAAGAGGAAALPDVARRVVIIIECMERVGK